MTRRMNQQHIISMLAREGDMSRAELARRMGLSKPAISDHIELFIDAGIVLELGEGATTRRGGRKPRILHFNDTYRTVAAIDLSMACPMIAVGNLRGDVLQRQRLDAPVHGQDAGQRITACIDTLHRLLLHTETGAESLGMIVICFPGIFSKEGSLVRVNPQFGGWVGIGLGRALREAFSVPVQIHNDMNAAALGELWKGNGRGCQSLVHIGADMGLGAGIIIDGKLHLGAHRAAGELSFSVSPGYGPDNVSFEKQMTVEMLLRDIQQDLDAGAASKTLQQLVGGKALTPQHLLRSIELRDAYAMRKLESVGTKIGYLFTNIMALLDPEVIVIGGEYLLFWEILGSKVEEILSERLPFPANILPSALGDLAGVCGAFVLARESLYAQIKL